MFSNGINRTGKHTTTLRFIFIERYCNYNKVDRELEDNINMLLHKYNIKREVLEEN